MHHVCQDAIWRQRLCSYWHRMAVLADLPASTAATPRGDWRSDESCGTVAINRQQSRDCNADAPIDFTLKVCCQHQR